LLHTVPKITVG